MRSLTHPRRDDSRPLVEDAPNSRSAAKVDEPHFEVFPEFRGKSYLERYDLLCQRLVAEQLYTSTALVASRATARKTGAFTALSPTSDINAFLANLTGHIVGAKLRVGE